MNFSRNGSAFVVFTAVFLIIVDISPAYTRRINPWNSLNNKISPDTRLLTDNKNSTDVIMKSSDTAAGSSNEVDSPLQPTLRFVDDTTPYRGQDTSSMTPPIRFGDIETDTSISVSDTDFTRFRLPSVDSPSRSFSGDTGQGENFVYSDGPEYGLVGLHYPGLSVGLRSHQYTFELKWLDDSDISIVGGRFYHHVLPFQSGNFYWGLDVSQIDFEGDVSEGSGLSTGGLLGMQYRFGGSFSVNLDAGPYYIHLEDESSNLTVNNIQYVINSSINWHLF
ncbi:MAG: hypothetical protein ABEJ65_02320 [bacterium]